MSWKNQYCSNAKLSWRTDPSEIERTYNIRKQQTWFNWVCSRELMESATILTPPSTILSGICFPPEPNIPEGPEYEKISTLYWCTERSFTNCTQKQQQPLRPLNNLENESFRNRENLQYKKIADSVLLSQTQYHPFRHDTVVNLLSTRSS